MTTSFLFPGQGSQAVGMGADILKASSAAKLVLEETDSTLDTSLSALIYEGPISELTRSENAQPAILSVSIAILRAAQEIQNIPSPEFFAGHSVGEYTALVASNALTLSDGLKLVRRRGQLMQLACQMQPSSMAALIGLDLEKALDACNGTTAQIANVNSSQQIVIGGKLDDLEIAIENAKALGARRAIKLEVAGAFHTEVMRPAQEPMELEIQNVTISHATSPIIANTTGLPISEPEQIREELKQQLCGCVYWQQSMETLTNLGVNTFIEFGPGGVLSGLAKRIAPNASIRTISTIDDINALD
ncbi:MAG: ACP S-malonyltransferase [SAR202 cluster bacterium]|nr:ACP S-malonyltransferase [SAR202 cluster bacterium]